MRKIVVPKPNSDNLISSLSSLYHTFKDASPNETLQFDISKVEWLYPLLALPISAYIHKTNSSFINNNAGTKPYAKIIKFPTGIDTVNEFEIGMQKEKSYVPISILKKEAGAEREKLETLFSQMIYKVIGVTADAKNAIYYPISELVTNIFEHSKQNSGYIFGQYYPKKGYLDMCIVDTGRGLATAYNEEKQLNISDSDAIVEVMSGHSTKNNKERGYGVRTSKRVICEALGGSFILISGSSALVSQNKEEKIVKLNDFFWQGVIIAYRILRPNGDIDISTYLE